MLQQRFIFFIALIFSGITNSYANAELDKVIKNFQSLEAQFEQHLLDETGQLTEISQGNVAIQRPKKFRWDYHTPYEQLIIADGERVWVYDKDLEQVTVKNLDDALRNTPAFLLKSTTTSITKDFTVKVLKSEQGSQHYQLTPKDKQAPFARIELVIKAKQVIEKLILKDKFEQTTIIQFTQPHMNRDIEAGFFIFTPPAGTDIIEDKK